MKRFLHVLLVIGSFFAACLLANGGVRFFHHNVHKYVTLRESGLAE